VSVKALRVILFPVVMLLLIALPSPSLIAAPSEEEPYRNMIVVFFDQLMKGEVENAFHTIISKSLIEGKPQETSYLIRQTKNALAVYGDISGYQRLTTECKTERVCLSRYMSFSKNYPMLWRFIFYQREGEWILLHISFNDSVKTFFSLE
jgi:hypothetical protein